MRRAFSSLHLVPCIFDMKLSTYEFLYVIFSSSLRDCCFTSAAGTFNLLFLMSEDFATTEYFINHIKKGALLKSIYMFKVPNIYIYIYNIYIIYIYNIYNIYIIDMSYT